MGRYKPNDIDTPHAYLKKISSSQLHITLMGKIIIENASTNDDGLEDNLDIVYFEISLVDFRDTVPRPNRIV